MQTAIENAINGLADGEENTSHGRMLMLAADHAEETARPVRGAMAGKPAEFRLGDHVVYKGRAARIIGRTFERHPRYDISVHVLNGRPELVGNLGENELGW